MGLMCALTQVIRCLKQYINISLKAQYKSAMY